MGSEDWDTDSTIRRLVIEQQAHLLQISHLRERLITTLDTIDALERSHRAQMAHAEQQMERVNRRLRALEDMIQQSNAERRDLQEAVNLLVEKVERQHDLSLWPYGRMQASSQLDSLPLTMNCGHDHTVASSYAGTMIASLRAERDAERSAHAETRRVANERISMLEAKLAIRETELEHAMVRSNDLDAHPVHLGPSARPQALSSREVDKIIQLANQRNKQLEAEIKYLARRLDRVQATSQESANASKPSMAHADSTMEQPIPVTRRQDPPQSLQSILEKRDRDHDILSMSNDEHINQATTLLQTFEAEIAEFAEQVTAFKGEREALSDILPTLQQFPPTVEHRESYIEHEEMQHTSDRRSPTLLFPEQNPEQRREPDTEHGSSSCLPAQPTRNGSVSEGAQVQHLLDSDGEISMDLATPLNPTSILPSSRSRSPSRSPNHSIESPLIALLPSIPSSPSPYSASPLLPRELALPPSHMSPLGMEEMLLLHSDVERSAQNDLAEASQPRRQLEISHNAFKELQDMVIELLDSSSE